MLHPFARGYSWGTVYNVRVPQGTEHDPWFFYYLDHYLGRNLKVEKSCLQLEVDSLADLKIIEASNI